MKTHEKDQIESDDAMYTNVDSDDEPEVISLGAGKEASIQQRKEEIQSAKKIRDAIREKNKRIQNLKEESSRLKRAQIETEESSEEEDQTKEVRQPLPKNIKVVPLTTFESSVASKQKTQQQEAESMFNSRFSEHKRMDLFDFRSQKRIGPAINFVKNNTESQRQPRKKRREIKL